MQLSQETILYRAADLKLQVDSSNMAWITMPEGRIECGPHSLALLDAFAQPRSLGAALEQLRGPIAGFQDWIDLTNTLAQLYQAGVLRDQAGAAPPALAADPDYYVAPGHVALLNSRTSVDGFLRGIRAVVRPGDLVV